MSNGGSPKNVSSLLDFLGRSFIWIGIIAMIVFFYRWGGKAGLRRVSAAIGQAISTYFGAVPPPTQPALPQNLPRYSVLISGFTTAAEAGALIARLNASNIRTAMHVENQRYYVIVAQRYPTRGLAESDAAKVQKKGFPARVMP